MFISCRNFSKIKSSSKSLGFEETNSKSKLYYISDANKIGKKLLLDLERFAIDHETPNLVLQTTEPFPNEQNTQVWYSHLGYQVTDKRKEIVNGRVYVTLAKRLNQDLQK